MSEYIDKVVKEIEKRNSQEPEFLQAVKEVFGTIKPAVDAHKEYEKLALLERMAEPERIVTFRVPWVNDNGEVVVNRGYRELN